ncbi:hypothetical protein AAFF_G00272100, partial [Aldrovandia affinis]
ERFGPAPTCTATRFTCKETTPRHGFCFFLSDIDATAKTRVCDWLGLAVREGEGRGRIGSCSFAVSPSHVAVERGITPSAH